MIYCTNWVERLNRDYKRTPHMRGDLTSPEITLLLLGGVSMNYKAYKRNLLKLDYEQVKFDWEEEELRAVKRRRGRSEAARHSSSQSNLTYGCVNAHLQ